MYASTGIDTDLCGKCFAVCAYTQRYLRSGYHSRSEFHRNAIFLRKFKKPLDKPPHIWYNIKVIDQWRSRLVGRGRTTGNRVGLKRVSRVRISASPPKHLICVRCFFVPCSVKKRQIVRRDGHFRTLPLACLISKIVSKNQKRKCKSTQKVRSKNRRKFLPPISVIFYFPRYRFW